MLQLRPDCECCNIYLAPDSKKVLPRGSGVTTHLLCAPTSQLISAVARTCLRVHRMAGSAAYGAAANGRFLCRWWLWGLVVSG